MIIDSHEHLMLPTEFQLKKLEQAGVDRAILFCTTPHPEQAQSLKDLKNEMGVLYKILSGGTTKEDNIRRMKGSIAELVAVLKEHPDKFYGFGLVPLEMSAMETGEWIETHVVSNNLKGVGEFTPGSDEQVRQLEPVFQALVDFPQFPIWVHTFNPVSASGINILMELTNQYPTVPVIFGHMGGYHWMDVIEFAKSASNVYVDLSAVFSTLAAQIAITELPERCLFSSDAPYGEPSLNKHMIEYVSPSDTVTRKVLGENILRLIGECGM